MGQLWKYTHQGVQAGPVDEAALAAMIQDGTLPADVLVCREGAMHWQSARDVDCFQGAGAAPPAQPIAPAPHGDRMPGQALPLPPARPGFFGSIMGSFNRLPKPAFFSLAGAVGCLLGAAIAELALMLFPAPPPTSLVSQNICVLVDTSLSMAQSEHAPPTKQQLIAILIDTSGSMSGGKLSEVKKSSTAFVQRQGDNQPTRQFGVFSFDSRARTDQAFTSQSGLVQTAINQLSTSGSTQLDDGLRECQQALAAANDPGSNGGAQQFVVIFTDGESDEPGQDMVIADQLRNSGVTLLAIHTADADQDHLLKLTGDARYVISTAAGQFDQAFVQVEEFIEEAGKQADPSEIAVNSKIAEVKKASVAFADRQKTAGVNLALVQFDDGASVLQPLTRDIEKIKTAIATLTPKGETALDLGLDETLKQFPPAAGKPTLEEGARDFVIVFTDGKPNDEAAALAQAQRLRDRGVHLFAIHTADAPAAFLQQLTGDPSRVISTQSGDFESAFVRIAEKIEETPGIAVSSGTGGLDSLMRNGVWFALLAAALGLAFAVAQNQATSGSGLRRGKTARQILIACLIGLIAGFLAGSANLLFEQLSQDGTTQFIGGVVAWTLLATVIGYATTFIIVNFKASRAILGGLLGGLIGGAIFNLIRVFQAQAGLAMGETVGRLISAVFVGGVIGLFIAWVEQLTREAFIVIHWGPNEQSTINLGSKPVTIGNQEDDVFVNGLPQCSLSIILTEGRIIATQQPGNSQIQLQDQSNIDLGKVQVVVHAFAGK